MYGPKTSTKNSTKTQNTKWNEASNALLGNIKENRMKSISKDTQRGTFTLLTVKRGYGKLNEP